MAPPPGAVEVLIDLQHSIRSLDGPRVMASRVRANPARGEVAGVLQPPRRIHSCMVGRQRPALPSEGGGRFSELRFEGPVECGFGAVADEGGDLCDLC